MDSDDEIELLKQPHSGESEAPQSCNQQPFAAVNLVFTNSSSVEESSIDPASVHALQSAFTKVKQNYNEQSRKYNELSQRHKLIQKSITTSKTDQKLLDPIMGDSPAGGAGVGGAGSYNEEETITAEIRAKQGYIQHLERELLRSNNSLTKGNAEIDRLKKQLLEVDGKRQTLEHERDRLKCDVQHIVETLQQSTEKDRIIQELQERLDSTAPQLEELQKEITEMKGCIGNSERTTIQTEMATKEHEIQDLKSRLKVAESEKESLINNYKELEKHLSDKDRDIAALEAKHKQYAIENEITRKTVQAQIQRGSESFDEVDGDREMLEKAFQMINQQHKNMQELKNKVEQQKFLINNLLKTKEVMINTSLTAQPVKDFEEREAAQGASFHPYINDENPKTPIYMNHSPQMNTSQTFNPNLLHIPVKQVLPNTSFIRRSSERGDYRGLGSGSQIVSPRINDSVKPTGNTNIPRMIAAEQSHPLVCIAGSNNVIDAHIGAGLASPRGQVKSGFQNNINGLTHPNAREGSTSPRTVREPTTGMQNEVTQPKLGEYDTSPRAVQQSSPNLVCNEETSVLNIHSSINYSGRSRSRPTNNVNCSSSRQITANGIPDRMTQSEIIVRDHSKHDATTHQPVPHLDFSNTMSRSNENVYFQGQAPETSYLISQRTSKQPDYENVYEAPIERESPTNKYDHSIYANDPQMMMSSRTPVGHQAQPLSEQEGHLNSVSALKICPLCNVEFSRLTIDQFQTHVFECFDNNEEPPATLQPGINNQSEEDKTCPMCGETFPMGVAQEAFEQHVLAHFGEEPLIERFELLNQP